MATADPDRPPTPPSPCPDLWLGGGFSLFFFLASLPSEKRCGLEMYIITLISLFNPFNQPLSRPPGMREGTGGTQLSRIWSRIDVCFITRVCFFFFLMKAQNKHRISFSQWCCPISVIHFHPHPHQDPMVSL